MSNSQNLDQVMATAKAKVDSMKAQAKVQRQVTMLTNDRFLEAKASLELKQEDINKVKEMIEACKSVMETVVVYDNRTKQNRKWSGSSNFNFDPLVIAVSNLFGNVQYSTPAHKELMMSIVNVPELLINEFNRIMNSNTRYSSVQDMIIQGSVESEEHVKGIVQMVGEYMGIEFNLDQFKQKNLDQIEQRAMLRAERDQAQHEEAKLLHSQALSL